MANAVIASYNTHGGVGLDFRFAPRRIARVVLELKADIIALQELTSRAAGFDMLEELRLDTGYHAIGGPTLQIRIQKSDHIISYGSDGYFRRHGAGPHRAPGQPDRI